MGNKENKKEISVLGTGGWGTALSIVLHNKGHETVYETEYARGG